MGLFDFLKTRKNIDPIWGKIELQPLGYTCKVNFALIKYPVRLRFSLGRNSPIEEERTAFKILEEKYSALVPDISEALYQFWKQYKKEHDTPENYSQSFPTINNSSEMRESAALFIIEFGPKIDNLKMFYEFGYHSEYVFAVALENFTVKGVEFS